MKSDEGSGVARGFDEIRGLDVFRGRQAQEVIRYVREEYGDELEFLWEDENGVWRNPTNRKWYGLMMRVKSSRLGLLAARSAVDAQPSEDEVVEILNLRFEKGMAREFVTSFGDVGCSDGEGSCGERTRERGRGILPGYHMNKNNWITVMLDYGVMTEEVLALIDKSYRIVAAGK